MLEIERAFERQFSVNANTSNVDIAYRKWLLNGAQGTPPSTPAESERVDAENWCKRCQDLIAEAKVLAEAGIGKISFEFDDLKRRAQSLDDECFSGTDWGTVFGYAAQAFDAASIIPDSLSQAEAVDSKWIAIPYISDKDKFRDLLNIQKIASRDGDNSSELARVCGEFLAKYKESSGLVEDAKSNGSLLVRLKKQARKFASTTEELSKLEQLVEDACIPLKQRHSIFAAYDAGKKAKNKAREVSRLKELMKKRQNTQLQVNPDSHSVAPHMAPEALCFDGIEMSSGHPNSILGLKPSAEWTIVADETGSEFGDEAFAGGRQSGKYVFVMIPSENRLSRLPERWHAVEASITDVLGVAENLYKSGCGILGIPAQNLYKANTELWYGCIETLLDVMLRLLPVDGKTKIYLNVENRGSANSKNDFLLERIASDAMFRLSLINPEKAQSIRLRANFVEKTECPYNGYVDAVAYSWGCDKSIRGLFRQFGWAGPCLVSEDAAVAQAFRRCLELVHSGGALPVADWNALVTCREAYAVGSLVGALLRAFGEEARKDVDRWRIYLDYVLTHLDSKAIKMSVLTPQINWLKEYEPVDSEIPPRLRLLWLTAQLAASNHQGGTAFGSERYREEFKELSARLKDEDAPLVCFAALHLAVEMTDAYRFEDARALLLPWESEPIAVPGLRYHAQVLSSLGQHTAFLGENEKALEYFDLAMMLFTRLSDEWQRDFDHTCAYAVIAAMDCGAPKFNELMARYLYGAEWRIETMVDMAQQFAAVGEDEPDSKYAHAILLRYLVMLPESDPIRAAYVERNAQWKWSADGHPWELIAFYRALLLQDNDPMRKEWLKRGYELCLGQGPTLQVIAAVIGAARLAAGDMSSEEYLEKVEEVASALPDIGAERISALCGQVENPIQPLDLAKAVLPFNFR